MTPRTLFTALVAAAAAMSLSAAARADAQFGPQASWTPPAAEAVKAALDEHLETLALDGAVRAQIDAQWAAGEAEQTPLLDRVVAALAVADDRVPPVVEITRGARPRLGPPRFAFLDDEQTPPLVRNNVRLYYARWLVQEHLFDEAKGLIRELTPAEVVDPAALLFYQAVAHHWLLNKEECLAAVSALLERKEEIPRRYAAVAVLLEADIKPLKVDSLDEIARLMNDIRRRLELGRAGARVRQQEDDVIAKLDKLIEELEQQQQQQQQSAGGAGGGQNPSSPMPDSMPGGMKGPGNVDPKDLGDKSGWGNLPPKERQEALQQIGKEFPSHYREVIEEYFRKLARDGGSR